MAHAPRQHAAATVAALVCSLSLLTLAASPASRAQQPGADTLDEVVVTGERTGPGLWHVHRGDAHLWILGSAAALPKGMTWRSKQVEEVLGGSRVVLMAKPLGIGIARALWLLLTQRDLLLVPGGHRLKDVLPPDLYARFAVQRAKYTHDPSKWERFRPIIAVAFLEEDALHSVGLTTKLEINEEVRKLARKHDVRVEEIKIAGVRDLLDTLRTVPPATENKCVAASLGVVESGLPRLVDRANAWATGDVARLQAALDTPEDIACRDALSTDAGSADLLAQFRRAWLKNFDQQLEIGGVSMAVVNIDLLLEPHGVIDQLRAQGYEVEGP